MQHMHGQYHHRARGDRKGTGSLFTSDGEEMVAAESLFLFGGIGLLINGFVAQCRFLKIYNQVAMLD